MSPCSSTSDCFKASFQYKLEKALGKTTPGETKLQWQNTSEAPARGTPPLKSADLGANFDADG